MTREERELLEKLKKVERLHAGAASAGERAAAADAMARIQQRLATLGRQEKAQEYKFRLVDEWSRRLLEALLLHHGHQPYRKRGQHRYTVLARVPRSFVDLVLWPQFLELSGELQRSFDTLTEQVIAKGTRRA